MSTTRNFACALVAAAVLAGSATASAATKTATFTVTATVISDCAINSASNIAFGSVGVMLNDASTTGTISVTCSPGTAYTLALDAGTGTGSVIANRIMSSGTNALKYQLYRDAAFTQVWGNTAGTDTSGGTGSGTGTNYTVYAVLPKQSTPPTGTYTSTVTATVAY